MSAENLVGLVHGTGEGTWAERNRLCFDSLSGEPTGRYPKTARKQLELRAPEMNPDSGVPFASCIHLLGRPGQARKVQAICDWLNREFGRSEQIAWAKRDPTRTDIGIPAEFAHQMVPYLFHIDEINRPDLGKVLGEALYLLEIDGTRREIELPYDFGSFFGRALYLPENL